jgi:hypothetical protein
MHTVQAEVLPEYCFDADAAVTGYTHESYGVPQHKHPNVTEDTWRLVDSMTALDKELYHYGRARLLHEFHAFNRELPRGRPLGSHLLNAEPVL